MKEMGNGASARTVIVITRSDLIKATTIPMGSKTDKEMIERLKRNLERCKNELNSLDIEECNAAEEDNDQKLAEIAKKKRVLDIWAHLRANFEKAHRIRMRSASNRKALEGKLLYNMPVPPKILSISNTAYARHVAGYKAKDSPVLDVEQTGIPSLRRAVSTFPNEVLLNDMKHQQEVMLPALLNPIRLYTSKSPSDRKENMMEHVVKPKALYSNRLKEVIADIEKEVDDFVDILKAGEEKWIKVAGGLCDQWQDEFPPSVFLNLLNRDGYRRGDYKRRQVDLRGELIGINSDEMHTSFSRSTNWILGLEKDLVEAMDLTVSDMLEDLKSDPHEPFMALDPFYIFVNGERAKIPALVKDTFAALLKGIDEIRAKVTQGEEDAYLVDAMLPIYAKVPLLKGGKYQTQPKPKIGWPTYRKVVFKDDLTKVNGVWATVCAHAESELQELLTAQSKWLVEAMGTLFDGFENGFNMLCEEKEATNPQVKLIRDELRDNIMTAEQIINGPMQQAYEALERDFHRIGLPDD